MIEDRWVRISALHCSTLGDNLTFYLPELLCHICHWTYSTASYGVLSVSAGDYRCIRGPSAPSSEMHLGVLFFKGQSSGPCYPWKKVVAPLVPTKLYGSSHPFRLGPIVKMAWPCEAAILLCQTRFRSHSFLSSQQLPLIWTHPRTLTEVGPPRGYLWPHLNNNRSSADPKLIWHSSLNKHWQKTENQIWYKNGK